MGQTPPGWTSNPSAWKARIPVAVLFAIGLAIATYLALVQTGVLASAWDPFFGNGTDRVLISRVSGRLPVSDALIGAVSYALDLIIVLIGGESRWKTMPWLLLLFGVLLIFAVLTSIGLTLIQPLVVGAWCTLCLGSAAVSFAVFAVTLLKEPLASLQYLKRVHDAGGSVWAALWGRAEEAPAARAKG